MKEAGMKINRSFFFPLACILILLLPAGALYSADKKLGKNPVQVGFRVRWDGKVIPGIFKVTGLKRTTEVIVNRTGDSPNYDRRSPGTTVYEAITLTRTKGKDVEFEKWANLVLNPSAGPGNEMSLKSFRKDLLIEILDPAGRLIMSFKVYRAWPSEYVALSGLDDGDDSAATESLVLQHEGFERDPSVIWPE
jgi:phage tail-like protein